MSGWENISLKDKDELIDKMEILTDEIISFPEVKLFEKITDKDNIGEYAFEAVKGNSPSLYRYFMREVGFTKPPFDQKFSKDFKEEYDKFEKVKERFRKAYEEGDMAMLKMLQSKIQPIVYNSFIEMTESNFD